MPCPHQSDQPRQWRPSRDFRAWSVSPRGSPTAPNVTGSLSIRARMIPTWGSKAPDSGCRLTSVLGSASGGDRLAGPLSVHAVLHRRHLVAPVFYVVRESDRRSSTGLSDGARQLSGRQISRVGPDALKPRNARESSSCPVKMVSNPSQTVHSTWRCSHPVARRPAARNEQSALGVTSLRQHQRVNPLGTHRSLQR